MVDIYPSFMTLARFLPFGDPMQDVGDGAGNRHGEEFCLWVLILMGRVLTFNKVVSQCDA